MERQNLPIKDSYKSISKVSTGIFKDNGSKFLAFAYPITKEEEVKPIIQQLKKEYFDARHHCYAYRIGYAGDTWRYNDDGEPSSTAGKPIFGQILSCELSDILIVVVRYFGGIKLGVPGLIRAYKGATMDAIENAEIVEKIATKTFIVHFEYLQMNNIMKAIKEMELSPYQQEFNLNCQLKVDIRLTDLVRFTDKFTKIEGCRLDVEEEQ